jgi:hypothetical protein
MLLTFHNPHPEAPAHPSTPKVLRVKKCAPTFSVVFTLDSHLNIFESWGTHQLLYSSVVFTLDSHLSLSESWGMHQLWNSSLSPFYYCHVFMTSFFQSYIFYQWPFFVLFLSRYFIHTMALIGAKKSSNSIL